MEVRLRTIRLVALSRRHRAAVVALLLVAALVVTSVVNTLLNKVREARARGVESELSVTSAPAIEPTAPPPSTDSAVEPPRAVKEGKLAPSCVAGTAPCALRVGPGLAFASVSRADSAGCRGQAGEAVRVRGSPIGEWTPVEACGRWGYVLTASLVVD